jgi:hypothetical protein
MGEGIARIRRLHSNGTAGTNGNAFNYTWPERLIGTENRHKRLRVFAKQISENCENFCDVIFEQHCRIDICELGL